MIKHLVVIFVFIIAPACAQEHVSYGQYNIEVIPSSCELEFRGGNTIKNDNCRIVNVEVDGRLIYPIQKDHRIAITTTFARQFNVTLIFWPRHEQYMPLNIYAINIHNKDNPNDFLNFTTSSNNSVCQFDFNNNKFNIDCNFVGNHQSPTAYFNLKIDGNIIKILNNKVKIQE